MSITGLPTFADGILTASQLNAIVTAIEAKFAGGINSGDFSWPLTAAGNIDMAGFQILNIGKFWNAYSLADRSSSDSVQDVLDTLSGDGGGAAIVPGNYSEAIPADGITIPANVILVGDGESSELVINASPSNGMVRIESADDTAIINLKLSGNTAADDYLLEINGSDNARIHGVHFETHGASPYLAVLGGSDNLSVYNCHFESAGDDDAQDQIFLDDCTDVRIIGCKFENWTNRAILVTPGAAASVDNVIVASCVFVRSQRTNAVMTADGPVEFLNTNNRTTSGFIFSDNHIYGNGKNVGGLKFTGNGASGIIINGNNITTNIGEPAVLIGGTINRVSICDNSVRAAYGDGFVIGSSDGTEVTAGTATAYQVTDITISGNSYHGNNPNVGDGAALIMAVSSTSGGLKGSVTGNKFLSQECDTVQVWNVGVPGSGTRRPLFLTITGNFFSPLTTSTRKGFSCESDMGLTNNGDIGTDAISWWFTFVANITPNTASGTDMTHNATNKCVVQDNNA